MKYTYKHTLHACYWGYITQAVVNNLAPLLFIIFRNEFGISYEMIGRLILFNFGSQIIVDFIAIRYVDRFGYRNSAVLAHLFCAAGLVSMGILPRIMSAPYLGLLIAVVLYAIGGGLIEVLISPIVNALPGDAKSSAMSLLHSFYCWGQMGVVLITTLLLKLIGNDLWYLLPICWSVIPLLNMLRFRKVPLAPDIDDGEKISLKQLFSSKLFAIALLLMICAGASELAMSQWSSLFAEKGLGIPKIAGDLLGPCLFAVFMGIGRLIYGIKGDKIHLKRALVGCGVLCVMCYLATVFIPNPLIALFGCALTGLSVSLMWPGMFSLTAEKFPGGGTAMFGLMAVAGDIGCSVGPWLTGVVSDSAQKMERLSESGIWAGLEPEQIGLRAGLFAALIFPVILLVGLYFYRKSPVRGAA